MPGTVVGGYYSEWENKVLCSHGGHIPLGESDDK